MKVLYINEDRHELYLDSISNPVNENIYIIPKRIDSLKGKQYTETAFSKIYPNHQFNIFYRYKLAKDIVKIAEIEKPDVIHFATADDYLRLFGLTLNFFKKYNLIITLHWCRNSFLRNIARRQIVKNAKGVIFHVKNAPVLKDKEGNKKSEYIILPADNKGRIFSRTEARSYFNLSDDEIIFSFVGSMEKYKGIEVLLNSIKHISRPITLILAGKPGEYSKSFLESFNSNPNVKMNFMLNYLSDEDFTKIICASNYLVLPYKKEFEASSGPMTEAVRCGVPIIAPNYNNLGVLTNTYDLGKTFEVEDSISLAKTIDSCVDNDFEYSDNYLWYQKQLHVEAFRESQQAFYSKFI